MKSKIKFFWEKYEYKIVLGIGFVLVAVISFEAGVLEGGKMEQKPIIIEKPAEISAISKESSEVQNSAKTPEASDKTVNSKENCPFLGSKNSNKYHIPTCQWAKRIKPENVTCFSSEDEAKSKGYLPDKNCIK